MNHKALDINTFYKMLFIYNALTDGWNIRKLNNKNIEFKKKKKKLMEKYKDDDYLNNFIKNNLKLPVK